MLFPEAERSQAVLIGASRHRHLDDLPNVENNLTALSTVLMSASSWSLAENSHCRVVRDPETVDEVVHAVRHAARAASDALFVYYAGHGLLDPRNGDLSLSLVGSRSQEPYTAVLFEYLRREIHGSRASRRIVVLDCCYGARAFRGMSDPSGHLLEQALVHGTYLVSAAGETREALADDGEGHTAFTGELIRLCRQGIAEGPEVLDMDTLFRHVEAEMRAKSRPIPRQRVFDHADRLALVRNRAHGMQTSAAPPAEESAPAGVQPPPPGAGPTSGGQGDEPDEEPSVPPPSGAGPTPGGHGDGPDEEPSARTPPGAGPAPGGRPSVRNSLRSVLVFFAVLAVGMVLVYFAYRPEGDPTPGLDYSAGDKPTESHEMCRPPQAGGGCTAAGWSWDVPASQGIRTTLELDGAGKDRALAGSLRLEADCDATVEWDVTVGARRVEGGTLVPDDSQFLTESIPRDVETVEVTAQRTDTATCGARLHWDDAGLS